MPEKRDQQGGQAEEEEKAGDVGDGGQKNTGGEGGVKLHRSQGEWDQDGRQPRRPC